MTGLVSSPIAHMAEEARQRRTRDHKSRNPSRPATTAVMTTPAVLGPRHMNPNSRRPSLALSVSNRKARLATIGFTVLFAGLGLVWATRAAEEKAPKTRALPQPMPA
jgi:hypothetical protein